MDFFDNFFSIISSIGFILMVFAFQRDFKHLSTFKKISIIIICIGAISPTLINVIQVFLPH
ncbi:hypothetical protein [Enterococcus gilvus]|uniref:hypothetical protein n=1 Tax=Enterococcus gilvus TaxID=160453 RepID=UPI0028D51087|nr:hypothetical protein [Enterococcus gilvus]